MAWRDVASDGDRDTAYVAALFAFVCIVGFFGTIIPSGDTNSIAGVFAVMVALTGSRLAARGSRWGGLVLVLGLTIALYSHLGFFGYAVVYLLLEAIYYRDRWMAVRLVVAVATASVASLPQYFELLRYRDFFITNNIVYGTPRVELTSVARQIYYNTEILLHPHRWFNDYLSLTKVYLVVIAWVAFQPGRTRARLYSWLVLATMAMLRFDVQEAGYLFTREMHMLAALAPAPLAWFIVRQSGERKLAWALIALVSLYPQTNLLQVPHVDTAAELPIDAARIASFEGARVLVENSPHRDLDSDPGRRTQKTPFGVHFEAYLPAATGGQLFYGQIWDCWHWTPFRGEVVAAGSFRGEAIDKTPIEAFVAEMRRWGVVHLLVWSTATRDYLDAAPAQFTADWREGRWVHYVVREADPRAVVLEHGSASLNGLGFLEGQVALNDARRGELVVVRANYFPAWRAFAGNTPVPLFEHGGQLAFRAPTDGASVVRFEYPRRIWLSLIALAALAAGGAGISRLCVIPSSPSAAA